MQKVKKIPQRQCVGCREMKDKKSLLRVGVPMCATMWNV